VTFDEATARYLPVSSARPFSVHQQDSLVTPLIDGLEYFLDVRLAMGRTSAVGDAIYLLGWRFDANFRFNPDPNDDVRLGPVLAEKAAQGVDVRLIMSAKWQLLDYLQSHKEDELLAQNNNDLKNILRWFGPAGNIGQGTALRNMKFGSKTPLTSRVLFDYRGEVTGVHHQKAVVVVRGGTVTAFLGGLDFLGDRLDTSRHDAKLARPNLTTPNDPIGYYWHDAGVRVEGPAALDVLNLFLLRWDACAAQPSRHFNLVDGLAIQPSLNPSIDKTSLRGGKPTVPAAKMRGVYIALNLPERDAAGSKPFDDAADSTYGRVHTTGILYGRAIRAARRYIYIEDQYVAAPTSLFPVLGDAVRRGVKVIAVSGGYDDDTQAAVAPTMSGSQKAFVTGLGAAASGFKVFHVRETIVHSKLMIIDDEFFAIGSANFSDRSMMEATDTGPLGNLLKVGATDSELHVGAVDDRPGDQNAARALRLRLWAEHLRIDQWDAAVRPDLVDLSRALAIFSPDWGTPVSFAYPSTRLVEAKP
jgi:phosphatidylserine/phosphatidylglycerophosphate/cardiolipin synthase-like enzyme